jgi:hypothetical protein
MKHGKGAKKAGSAKKTPGKSVSKSQKARPKKTTSSPKTLSPKRAAPGRPGSLGSAKTDARANRAAGLSFTNPVVGNAFRRAVKKYSTALKRLTD